MSISQLEADGIPLLFLPDDGDDCTGGIAFRVGWADETLAVRGLTHLVGHLALSLLNPTELHHHLETHAAHTVFRTRGTAEHVVQVLSDVCGLLRDLPHDRVEGEKAVLAAESRTMYGGGGSLQRVRYGAAGYGLSSYPELGVADLTPDLASLWVQEAFTRGNAVAWFSGPELPATLDLALGEGRRQPPPETTSLTDTPAWYLAPDSAAVLVTGIVPRSRGARVFAEVLDRLATRRLRDDLGYCYQAGAQYAVRDATSATVVLRAEARPERAAAVAGEILDLLAELRWGPPDADLVGAAAADVRTETADLLRVPAGLADVARDLLLGVPGAVTGALELVDEPVSPDDVRVLAETYWGQALAQLPAGDLEWAGWHPAPVQSAHAATGRVIQPHDPSLSDVLVVGAEAVTRRTRSSVTTVVFRDVACMLAFTDGGRWLIGTDGIEVHVEPTLHAVDAGLVADIDAAVDRARVVRRPARHPGDLPGPRPAATGRAEASPAPQDRLGGLLRRLRGG
ncbi:hypothetical protein JQN72_05610 [Phycicoccus sp. CSK15P-2]|uniref:hypothetical protein n=1 Tax=Phycicoccus sp. CSK15P-2 TaxID=2807627 RepID=UPI001951F70D|nr:hypothetical protein [Phycicoccus sp. CSK15P-2]MBM6403716.1 hypothetical protein [Phycicoccus sp. CSK15P-2]